MNPEQWSGLVRVFVTAALAPGSYLVVKGILTPDQAAQLAPAIVTMVTVGGGALIGWWSTHAHSASAAAAAVNSNSVPGVMAVRESSALAAGIPPVIVTSDGVIKDAPPAPLSASAKPELKP
jgi:hypothetical protein